MNKSSEAPMGAGKAVQENNRQLWADIARGIGMLCIIAGHQRILWFNHAVFTFHVPIFFLISGYFLTEKDDLRTFIQKRIRGLLVPYAVACLMIILAKIPIALIYHVPQQIPVNLFRTFIEAVYGSGTNDNPTPFGIMQIGAIWFLLALFWSQLIVRLLMNRKWGWAVIIAAAIISAISSKYFWLPFALQPGITSAAFVYVGMLARKKGIDFSKINWALAIAGLVILAVEYYFGVVILAASNDYEVYGLTAVGAVFISYTVIAFSNLIAKIKPIEATLSFLGRNSVIILCFHILELNSVNWDGIYARMDAAGLPYFAEHSIVFVSRMIMILACTAVVLNVKSLRKIFGK